MDAHPAGDVADLCGAGGPPMPVILHLMTAMGGKFSGDIGADMTVYEFVRDPFPALSHVRRYLLRRPVLFLQQFQSLPYDIGSFARLAVARFLRSIAFACALSHR